MPQNPPPNPAKDGVENPIERQSSKKNHPPGARIWREKGVCGGHVIVGFDGL